MHQRSYDPHLLCCLAAGLLLAALEATLCQAGDMESVAGPSVSEPATRSVVTPPVTGSPVPGPAVGGPDVAGSVEPAEVGRPAVQIGGPFGVVIGRGRGLRIGGPNGVQIGGGYGARFGGRYGAQFGGGYGARFGGPNGAQFGGGNGARFGGPAGVQFGGRPAADQVVSPELPGPAAGRVLTFHNAQADQDVVFWLNELQLNIAPGETMQLENQRRSVIRFDRGQGRGQARYLLRPGDYRFRQTPRGLDLFRAPPQAPVAEELPLVPPQ